MSKIVFEMICLSNEIRYYVRRLSKKLGVTVNEFLVLNVIGLSQCNNEAEIKEKLYINHTTFVKAMEKLVGKDYVIHMGKDSFKLSEKGKNVLDEMTTETTEFFEFILTEEDKKNEELIRELNQKISDINIVGDEEYLIN